MSQSSPLIPAASSPAAVSQSPPLTLGSLSPAASSPDPCWLRRFRHDFGIRRQPPAASRLEGEEIWISGPFACEICQFECRDARVMQRHKIPTTCGCGATLPGCQPSCPTCRESWCSTCDCRHVRAELKAGEFMCFRGLECLHPTLGDSDGCEFHQPVSPTGEGKGKGKGKGKETAKYRLASAASGLGLSLIHI